MSYEIIYATESTRRYCKFEKYWIQPHDRQSGSFFHTLSVAVYSTTVALRPTNSDATTRINGENWQ